MTTDMSPSRRRSSLPWVITGAAVVLVAVVVTVVLTMGGDEGTTSSAGTPSAGPTSTATKSGYDLSTPEAAARSFAAAAKTGSGDTLLSLTCVGRPTCLQEHTATLDQAQVPVTQDAIREGVYELATHLEGAEFSSAVDGDQPGTKEVPYRTPEMTGDAYLSLTFVKSGGDWLYYVPTP